MADETTSQPLLLPVEVERITAGVEGWFGREEGRLLYRLAHDADPTGCIVEIGSWQGKSTIWLAAGARSGRGAHVVSIDPHVGTELRAEGETTEPALRANLARSGLEDCVEVIVSTSAEVAATWSRGVSLLWIDGDHSYEGALRDVDLWEPFLLPEAIVALHDTFVMPGPEQVVRKRLIAPGGYTSFVHAQTTTAARRCGRLTIREGLSRRVGLTRRSLFGIRLRAYDSNRYGFRTLRDLFERS